MRKISIVLVLAVAFCLQTERPVQGQEPMPELAYDPVFGDKPHWISEDLLLDSSGQPETSLLDEANQFLLNEALAAADVPEGGCFHRINKIPATETLGQDTLEKTLGLAQWVFSAEVTGTQPGMGQTLPGTLVRFEPKRIFLGPEDRRGPHFIFVPVGEVQLGDRAICVSDIRYPHLPEVGDEILLMVQLTARNQEGTYLTGNDSMLITFEDNERASLPHRFLKFDMDLQGLKRERLYELVADLLGESGE